MYLPNHLRTIAFVLGFSAYCLGQTPKPQAAPADSSNLAQQAADPTAPLMAFTLRDNYTSNFYGVPGSAHAFGFQPAIPFRAWKHNNLLRATATYNISGPGGAGVQDMTIFDLVVFGAKWGRWGAGPVVQFRPQGKPGQDTALAGPAVGFVAKKGKWNLGLFNQNLIGQNTRFSSLQPVVAYVVGKGFVLAAGDSQWGIDWSRPGIVSVPLGIQLSQLVMLAGQPVRFFVNPEYNARNLYGNPHWLVRFGITILSPMKP